MTNIAVSQAVGADPLLPARPVEPDRLHDRRQRRRELRRRALLQVRLHDQLRDRARGRAARRLRGARSAARSSTARATTCSARSSARRARSASPRKIWLRVIPKPEAVRTLVAFFDSTDAGRRGRLARSSPAGIVPGAIEMMDNLSIRAAEGATDAGYPLDAGRRAGRRARRLRGRVRGPLRAGRSRLRARGADRVRVAQDDAERELIWKARKAAFAAMGRIAPNYYVQDSVIPRTRLAEVLGRDRRARRSEYGLRVANVFHAGDGNLHPLVCYDGASPARPSAPRSWPGLIVEACVDAGGSITGEHGVGVDKKRYMPEMFAEPTCDVPAPALRVRPRRARQPRQGDAHPAAVRRGPRPLPPAPARGGRAGGAVLMAR